MPDLPQTLQRTDTVHLVREGHIAFDGHNSWYHAPPHLEPTFRTAQETRREVKFTADVECNIHAAELLPIPPLVVRLREGLNDIVAEWTMRLKVLCGLRPF
jgi:hypothetical protein